MLKIVASDSQRLAIDGESRIALVKRSSRGITGMDKQAFIKRSSAETSEELIEKAARLELKPGEELTHFIALGSTEAYGPNRNGDGFKIAACRAYHPYFVKHGRFYRNHKNTDPEKSYGVVKASAFNEAMSRIELLVALNGTKEAAKANGGLVADKEMEKLASGNDIAVSMACFADPRSPILTKEHGYLPIQNIRIGMHVWTHCGRWKAVTRLLQREYTGELYHITMEGIEDRTVSLTAEHPMYIYDADDFYWYCADSLKAGDALLHSVHEFSDLNPVALSLVKKAISEEDAYAIISDDWLSSNNLSVNFLLDIRNAAASLDYSASTLYEEDSRSWHIVLQPLMPVFSTDGTKYTKCLVRCVRQETVRNRMVYNLEVEDDQSYDAFGLVSHNCRVPFDICSYCGNKAHTRDEYCRGKDDGGMCKAGGLYNNIGRTVSVDGKLHQLHADNTEPDFFDLSNVFVPADRIAYSSGLLKTSSANGLSGLDLAAAWNLTDPAKSEYLPIEKSARAVSLLISAVDQYHTATALTKAASFMNVFNTKPLNDVATPRRYKIASVTKALLDRNACLTASQFLQLFTHSSMTKAGELAEIVAPLSNECYYKLTPQLLNNNPYAPGPVTSERLYKWAASQPLSSFHQDSFLKQAALNTMEPSQRRTVPTEALAQVREDPSMTALATHFALYKAAFVSALPLDQQDATAYLLVNRDYMSY